MADDGERKRASLRRKRGELHSRAMAHVPKVGGATPLFRGRADEAVVVLTDEQETRAMALDDPRKTRLLYAICEAGTLDGALRKLRDPQSGKPLVHPKQHNRWRDSDADYDDLYMEIKESLKSAWDDVFQRKAANGVIEDTYDGEGNLKQRRVREDSGLLRMVASSMLPKYRDDQGGGPTINILIARTEE